jgi:alkaline phosphatase
VIIGPGRQSILEKATALGVNLEAELPKKGFGFLASLEAVSQFERTSRMVVLMNSEEFDLGVAVEQAVRVLARNPRGFFLMVESNNHFKDARKTLERTVTFDRIIRQVAERQKRDTLILCTADHSYDLRMPRGDHKADILSLVTVVDAHTAEEVLVSADGPGAEQVRGIFPNTQLFKIMLSAYGWDVLADKRE